MSVCQFNPLTVKSSEIPVQSFFLFFFFGGGGGGGGPDLTLLIRTVHLEKVVPFKKKREMSELK